MAQLLARTSPEQPWVLEPTGRYSTTVAQQARAAGRTVWLASPRKAEKYQESIQDRAKTDQLDARGLGLYALTHDLPPYPLKSADVERLEQLLARRRRGADPGRHRRRPVRHAGDGRCSPVGNGVAQR